jgi:8-oxo-dGTP diphosphatase
MSEIIKNRPKVGVAVYILDDQNRVLLMHRLGSHGPGTWAPPGGHLENGESFLDCAKREVKEEVNIDFSDIEVLGVTNDIFSEDKHYITVQVHAKGISGEPKIMEPEKCSEIKWFRLDSLPAPLLLSVQHFFESNISKKLTL